MTQQRCLPGGDRQTCSVVPREGHSQALPYNRTFRLHNKHYLCICNTTAVFWQAPALQLLLQNLRLTCKQLLVLILPVHILGGNTSRRACLRRSRSALVGIRLPFSSSPRNRIVFMGFLKGSGPFSNAHVLGHCTGSIIIRFLGATMESRAGLK